MPIELRRIEKKRVLVVAPHPDDESLAVGGCLALHRRAGSAVSVAFVTIDRPKTSGEIVPRMGEADRASRVLGFDYDILGAVDGSVSRQEEFVTAKLAERIRATKPDLVYTPFPGDHHRDHQAVAASVSAAISNAGFRGEVCCYEMWSSLWPNCGIDISSVVADKRAAIQCYESQLNLPYVEAVLGLNRYRGLRFGVEFAEALFVCSPATFRDLCRGLSVI
jgi:LmbE family N-acetylglucosaminyl deacetylase